MKLRLTLFLLLFSTNILGKSECDAWPRGMVFVGLTDQGWQTFGVSEILSEKNDEPVAIPISDEMKTPVLSPSHEQLAYVDAAMDLRLMDLESLQSHSLLISDEHTYTQAVFDKTAQNLYAVQLKQGNSLDTDIVGFNLNTFEMKSIVIQRSAQFEPHLADDWLYYSNVHCVSGCGAIIQEIWRYHLLQGTAEQLTLLNQISRQPFVDDSWLYFTSNKLGSYHIYRQSLLKPNTIPEQLTTGEVQDSNPVVKDGNLYFIRQKTAQQQIMCLSKDLKLYEMGLPVGITQVRDLEI